MPNPPGMTSEQVHAQIHLELNLLIADLELRVATLRRIQRQLSTAASGAGESSCSTQPLAQPIDSSPTALCLQPIHGLPPVAPLPQPIPASTPGAPGSALQPAPGDADSEQPPLPTATPDDDVTPPTYRPLPPPIALTLQDLELLPHGAGICGNFAGLKMMELRLGALRPDGLWTVDITHGGWPWRRLLRAACPSNRAFIVGPGITSFTFRLIPDTLDLNYRNVDRGERHVFEIHRADHTRCHLHYTVKGVMDKPFVVPLGANMLVTAPDIPQGLSSLSRLLDLPNVYALARDGTFYNWQQFQDHYGAAAEAYWYQAEEHYDAA